MTISDATATGPTKWSPLAWRNAWLSIDQNPAAQAWVSGLTGKLAIHAVFALIIAASLQFTTASLALITLTLFAIALLPQYRMPLIVGSSLFYLFVRPFRVDGWTQTIKAQSAFLPTGLPSISLQLVGVGLFVLFAAGFLFWQSKHKESPVAKRPLVALFVIWTGLLAAAYSLPSGSLLSAILWSVVGVSISSMWYLAYAAHDQKTKDPTPTLARAGFMRAFWGGSATPIGKSFGYLNKFDAKTDDDLAITRLKGLKLAVWALILSAVIWCINLVVYKWMNVPELNSAILKFADGNSLPNAMNWAGLISNYFLDLLLIAVWGHFIVATVRMIGFRIPRNTRNPLAARTLADFWNRYFYYFKELLVDFFFYPAFVRYFKKNTKLRIAFATFCAAAVGNLLYHVSRETYIFADRPIGDAFVVFQSAIFYSLALAAGLIISQLRGKKLSPEDGFLRYEVLPRLNVFAFFCFLKIFDDITGIGSLADRAHFTFSLFGL